MRRLSPAGPSRPWSACALAIITAAAIGGVAVGDAGPTGAVPRPEQVADSGRTHSGTTGDDTGPTGPDTIDPAVRKSIREALTRVRAYDPLPERAPARKVAKQHQSPAKFAVQYASNGIPEVALQAYHDAARNIDAELPACHLDWSLLAGIGRIESNHGRYGGAVPTAGGATVPAILGPVLDGSNNTARITDTDGGRYDGDQVLDRAVGPMQFLPGTWAVVGADGNGDGTADPNNLFDAALGAAEYLCAGDRDLQQPADLHAAVFSYNHSDAYVADVLGLAALYRAGRAPTLPTAPDPAGGNDVTGQEVQPDRSRAPSSRHTPKASHRAPEPTRSAGPEPSGSGPSGSGTSDPTTPPAQPTTPPSSPSQPTTPPSSPSQPTTPPSSPTDPPPTSSPTDPPPTATPPARPDLPKLTGTDPVIADTETPSFTAIVSAEHTDELAYRFELWPADHDAKDAEPLAVGSYRAEPGKVARWTVHDADALSDGTDYSLRVRASNADGPGEWSQWLDFTVTLPSDPTEPPSSPSSPPSSPSESPSDPSSSAGPSASAAPGGTVAP